MVSIEEIQATEPLAPDVHARVVRRTIFDCCKWDPQLEDQTVLAPFALVLGVDTWDWLREAAEKLAGETLAMEAELTARPELHGELGLPRSIVRALRPGLAASKGIARVMRFDFHPTTDGWRVSEVNCDVPGGFIEASGFTSLMAGHFPEFETAGNPADILVRAIANGVSPDSNVAFVHATAYTDDRQVMIYLSRRLETLGVRTSLVSPDQARWEGGRATMIGCGEVAAIVRFFPAEWLPNLGKRSPWRNFFRDSHTPQCNPGASLLIQSKRLPVVWDRLRSSSETWRALLPETCDPRRANWREDRSWILKPALGRVGAGIGMAEITSARDWKLIRRGATWFPGHWIAQKRFEAVPVETAEGPRYPCIGVFTVDGRACGIYGRMASRPLIDDRASDVAVLIARE